MQGKIDIKKALTVALALAAIVVPAAQADPWQFQLRSTPTDASDRQESESLRQFLANDDRHAGPNSASTTAAELFTPNPIDLRSADAFSRYVANNGPQNVSTGLRDYDAFRVPQSPLSIGEPGEGPDWPAIVAGASLLVLLAGFGITAVVGLRSRSRVAHS